jgi:recombination protein RecA
MGKKLDEAVIRIDKQFGAGSVVRLGDDSIQDVEAISTRWYSLDKALGIGGLPRGRVTEIYGMESSGKTTLALQVIAEAQSKEELCAIIDAEHALDRKYAAALGVKVDDLLVSQPDYGEQALEIAEALIRSGEIAVLVVDSVAALVPKAEVEGEMGDSMMGLHARLMSQALRKLTGIVAQTNTVLIFINQIRSKIGLVFGNPEVTSGGNALKFYSSVRLDLRKVQQIKEGEEVVGVRVRAKCVKNKTAAPAKEAEGDLMFGRGISLEGDILDAAIEKSVVEKSGAWLTIFGGRVQGRSAAVKYLEENPDVLAKLMEKLRA